VYVPATLTATQSSPFGPTQIAHKHLRWVCRYSLSLFIHPASQHRCVNKLGVYATCHTYPQPTWRTHWQRWVTLMSMLCTLVPDCSMCSPRGGINHGAVGPLALRCVTTIKCKSPGKPSRKSPGKSPRKSPRKSPKRARTHSAMTSIVKISTSLAKSDVEQPQKETKTLKTSESRERLTVSCTGSSSSQSSGSSSGRNSSLSLSLWPLYAQRALRWRCHAMSGAMPTGTQRTSTAHKPREEVLAGYLATVTQSPLTPVNQHCA
jgi:hypothetical protein